MDPQSLACFQSFLLHVRSLGTGPLLHPQHQPRVGKRGLGKSVWGTPDQVRCSLHLLGLDWSHGAPQPRTGPSPRGGQGTEAERRQETC